MEETRIPIAVGNKYITSYGLTVNVTGVDSHTVMYNICYGSTTSEGTFDRLQFIHMLNSGTLMVDTPATRLLFVKNYGI